MRALELQDYAENNGFDSVEFSFTTPQGKLFTGKFLDAYFGTVEVPEIAQGSFITIRQLRDILGDEQEYAVLHNKESK